MVPGAPLLVPLLLLEVPLWPGLAELLEAPADGRSLPRRSLEAESRAFTCLAPAPSLTWYLNGELQQRDPNGTGFGRLVVADDGPLPGGGATGSFVLTARRLDRQLNCSATDPNTGRVSSASVILHVQFKPEMVKLDAHYEEARDPGFLLVLFVLVQANPPANITWVDQDGQVMVNTSRFLIVDTKTYPWLNNHTVHVQLSSLARNVSFCAWDEDAGVTNSSSFPLPGFLDTRIELPLLTLVLGCVVALGTLLALGALFSCAIYRQGQKAAGLPSAAPPPLPSSDTNNLRPKVAHLPRANMSVPCNLQLNDLTATPTVKVQVAGSVAEQEEEEPANRTAPADTGTGQFPVIGYIYRVPSMSSDEIWL